MTGRPASTSVATDRSLPILRFLADESFDARVITALRAAEHDVQAIVEDSPGAQDRLIIEQARQEARILLTEDRELGQLVYADRLARGGGVLLVRCPQAARSDLPARIVAVVAAHGARLAGHHAVWTPGRLRLRRTGDPWGGGPACPVR